MSDVFICYSKQDRPVAEILAYRLNAFGFDTWWDSNLHAGEDFEVVIRAALDAAKAVIVIWSDAAAQSPWVRDEAKRAMTQDKLIPTHIPQFNLANLPLGFGQRHTSNVEDIQEILFALDRLGVERAPHLPVRTSVPIRELGEHPTAGGKVELVFNRIGVYYVKHGDTSRFVPLRIKLDRLTLEQAVELLKSAPPRGPRHSVVTPQDNADLAKKLRALASQAQDPQDKAELEEAAARQEFWANRGALKRDPRSRQ
jgi:hypothetical protein